MLARALLFSMLLCFAPAATAQPADNTPAAANISDPAYAAAHAMLVGSGIVDAAFDTIAAEVMPRMRASTLRSTLYQNASPTHQQALLAYLDTMPALLREEMNIVMEEVAIRVAPRWSELMTPDELTGVANFFSAPASQPFLQAATAYYLGNLPPGPPEEAARVLEEFMRSPAGLALERNGDAFNRILAEERDAALVRLMPHLQAVLSAGICAALEEECPQRLRTMQPT